MRKTKVLDAIVPPSRQRILAATVLQPEREWYVSDLASHLAVRPSSLQRDLARLAEGGVLRRRRDGNRVYFKADPDCPIFPELRQILAKTVGLVDVLREVLAPFATSIHCAFVYGSVARLEEVTESDVDLILIGNVGLAEIAAPLRTARERLARQVNPSVYSATEFAKKARSGHHFITKVLAREKLFVIGSEHDLDEIIGGEAGGGRAGIEARAG